MIKDEDDYIVITKKKMKIRIVRYMIEDKKYYIATNVFDYSIDTIKQIYHDRWKSEESFKYQKNILKLNTINEKSEIRIRKKILCTLIMSQLTYLMSYLYNNGEKNKVVNKRILTAGMYDTFLHRFFNNNMTKYYLRNFKKIYIKYIVTNIGKSFPHECLNEQITNGDLRQKRKDEIMLDITNLF